MPTVEMMACGGAVLASTAGALVETVGTHAHLIEPDDLDGWRDGMARVLQDNDWCEALREGVVELEPRVSIVQSPEITTDPISALFWRNMPISVGLAAVLSLIAPLAARLYHQPRTTTLLIAMGRLILATMGLSPARC